VQSKSKEKAEQSSASAVATIQQQSGCRIQLDREAAVVRIFGPLQKQHVAEQLLQQLSSMVSTSTVKYAGHIDTETLNKLAMELNVTFELSGTNIVVMGIRGAVEIAAGELLNLMLNERKHWIRMRRDRRYGLCTLESLMYVDKALARLGRSQCDQLPRQFSEDTTDTGSLSGTSCTSEPEAKQFEQYTSKPVLEEVSSTPSLGPCSTCGSTSFCSHCGTCVALINAPDVCAICHRANFCALCGAAIVKLVGFDSKEIGFANFPAADKLGARAQDGNANVIEKNLMPGVFIKDGLMYIGSDSSAA
jgi:hypothetical protein